MLHAAAAERYGIIVDDAAKRQQRESERCALLQLLLLLYSRPGARLPAAQLLTLAAAFQERIFSVPLPPRAAAGAEAAPLHLASDLVRPLVT